MNTKTMNNSNPQNICKIFILICAMWPNPMEKYTFESFFMKYEKHIYLHKLLTKAYDIQRFLITFSHILYFY